jgi:hypothetical protein
MPISKYFKGKGEKVMKNMKSEYGASKGESIFYATANKEKLKGSPQARHDLAQGFRQKEVK